MKNTFAFFFAPRCRPQRLRAHRCRAARGPVAKFAFASVLLLSVASRLSGEMIAWSNSSGGDFQTASNWNPPRVPGIDDVATFDLAAAYTVTWSAPSVMMGYRINAGDVTWNPHGYTVSISNTNANNVGTTAAPATLTVTNGTVLRDPGYKGTVYAFKLQGSGSQLRILGNGKYENLYYVKFEDGTTVQVDGPQTSLINFGYSFWLKDAVVVTNGAVWELTGGVKAYEGADIRIHGGRAKHKLTLSDLREGSSVLIAGGADVECGSCEEQYARGLFTLDNATYRYYYPGETTKGEFILYGEDALLQGNGALKFWSLWVTRGTVCPGGRNAVGTLEITGGIKNVTPNAGRFEFELAGKGLHQYDRVVLINDGRSNALEGFPDARWYPGGTLKVSFIDGFIPDVGDTFDILDYDSIAGTFDTLEFAGTTNRWDLSQLYATGEITYTGGAPSCALTVIYGSGDGDFAEATAVSIVADAAPENFAFHAWTDDTAYVADVHDPTTTVAMPGRAISVTATYTNLAPLVDAGADQMLDLPNNTVSLRGTVATPFAFGSGLTYAWTQVSGPGTVTFGSGNALTTEAQLSVAGTYLLRLTVTGSESSATDDLTVRVHDSERLSLPVIYTPLPKATAEMESYANIYTLDLQAFGIYNDGTHAAETSAGINRALQYAKTLGANRIVFPAGTYLVSETDPIIFDHRDTIVDLNGAILRIRTNGLTKYCIVNVVDGAENFRLTNGTIMGDRDTHDYTAGGEWGHALVLNGGMNMEFDHLTLTNAMGDGLVTTPNVWSGPRYTVYTNNLEPGAFTENGIRTPSAEKTRTIAPYNMSGYDGEFEFGYTAGYQGFPYVFDRAYQVCFYKADMTFIEKRNCIQYKKHPMPAGTTYLHLEFNQPSVESPLKYCGYLVNWRPPRHVHVHDLVIVKNRRNGLSVCGGQKMIIEENLFKENGGTAPGYGVDYEDGWELMQDIVFRRNRFDNNERGDLVVCAGSELIFEENVFEQGCYIWGRTHNFTVRNNQSPAAAGAGEGVTYRTQTGAVSIHHNRYENLAVGPKVIYDAPGLPTVRLFDESIYNCAMSAGYFVRADVHYDVKLQFYNSTFEDSRIELIDAESHDNRFIGCNISNSVWNSHNTNAFTNCNIRDFYTKSHTVTDRISFEKCRLNNVNVDVRHYLNQTQMDVVVDDCDVVLQNRTLVTVRTDRLDLLQITDCTIEDNWGGNLVDNLTGDAPATTVVIENNTYLP